MDLDTTGLESSPKCPFFPHLRRWGKSRCRGDFHQSYSILQDGKQIRSELHRFGADLQEEFIPHLLLVAAASNFSAQREGLSGMDCASPIKPSGLWKALLSFCLTFFFVRFCWKHEPFASTLTEVPEFTTPGGQGFFFHWMCKRIQMRKWAVLEFTRFWLCNLSYIKSVLVISDLGMIATALSCHLSAIFSDSSFVPRIGFLHAVCWNNF